ncbi:PadR family transcriptional regulator [Parachitinimonas caeni]|uniref:PadR family transcriptional regulator n=1 Tax=Parachitinimonas caeni TaxID=3031301 RepID=A0ABT7DZY1_9NEIS|nr:PadR family transcriptional regulator [Parachitinimonas caeni]MDK2125608.1 PadR family transcriptional regulator [Parachitinimonas caeni]
MKTQLKKGVLEMCVLALLEQHDSYAYEIVSTLADSVEMSEGTIYPLMRRLQNDGLVSTYLVESDAGPPRKYYRLEAKGLETLQAMKSEWSGFLAEVNKIVGANKS